MRLIYTLFTLALSGYGLFWLTDKNPDLKQKVEELLDFRTTNALEMRYGVEQVLELNQKKLLKEKGSRFLNSELKFYPFLLLEVKYSDRSKTKEGLILWDLTDGEMVLDAKTWEKSHGFADCILNHVQRQEFKILNFLSDKGGSCDDIFLRDRLEIEGPVLELLLRNCIKKNLIISCGHNRYRLHLEHCNLTSIPETKIYEQLSMKVHKKATRISKHFSPSQIEKTAKIAFAENFSIRQSTEIYLPVYQIAIQNSNGSTHTHHFNALTGKELPPARFYQ